MFISFAFNLQKRPCPSLFLYLRQNKDFLIEKRTGKTPASISAGRGFKKEESF